jgi:hypothetical protein
MPDWRMIHRCFVMFALLLCLAACSGGGENEGAGSLATNSSAAALRSERATTTIEASVIGGGDYPTFTVDAPPAWVGGAFVTNGGPTALGLSVWDVGRVPRDPCHWKNTFRKPGPGVDDLVGALVKQQSRHATEPTNVTLDGHRGRYLEWSVPAHMVVTGDADFEGCDARSNGHTDFISWLGDGEGERYEQDAGQVDMLWVLDVDGQRLVLDATYAADSTAVDRAELKSVAESLRFAEK